MPEELLVTYCAPTLAGLKTGNLFSCPCESKEAVTREVRALNNSFVPKGICVLPLQYSEKRALIYVFRPQMLKRDLQTKEAAELLQRCGYGENRYERCLIQLMERLKDCAEFPHEIGLFLSYPPEDVRGFMEHNAKDFKCVGCWKVYGDEHKARERFSCFEQCTKSYCRQFRCGVGLDRLAVYG